MKITPILLALFLGLLLSSSCADEATGNTQDGIDTCQIEYNINLGADTAIFFGDTLILDAGPCFSYYDWNNGQSSNQYLTVVDSGKYWVTAIDQEGKFGTDTITVSLKDTIRTCSEHVDVQVRNAYWLTVPCYYYQEETGRGSFRTGTLDGLVRIENLFGVPVLGKDTLDHLPVEIYDNQQVSIQISYDDDNNPRGYFLYTQRDLESNKGLYVHRISHAEYVILLNLVFYDRYKSEVEDVILSIRF